jgi:hypothetical protein
MNLKNGFLAGSLLFVVCAFTALSANAQTYNYTFSLPAITNVSGDAGSLSQFSITFTNGPFGQLGSVSGNYTPTDSPLASGSFYGVGWSSGSTLPSGNNDLNEIQIEYSTGSYPDTNVDVLSFAFLEPASFWATPGTVNFGTINGAADSANGWLYYYNDSFTTYTSLGGNTNTGASYSTWTNDVRTDTASSACDACTVTITETPVTTPETGSFLMLLASIVSIAAGIKFHNRRQSAFV